MDTIDFGVIVVCCLIYMVGWVRYKREQGAHIVGFFVGGICIALMVLVFGS